MSKLDTIIGDMAFVLDCMRTLKNILDSGDCNNCGNKECEWKPAVGEMVRHNCAHYIPFTGEEECATE